jgi:hypothetical protein
MDQKQILKKMVQFNQTALDNTLNAMTLLQEQTERMINLSLEQVTMLPKEGQRALAEWLKACRQGGETFKKTVDAGFQMMEAFLA